MPMSRSSRRGFLGMLGAAAAAALCPSLPGVPAGLERTPELLPIGGLLLPLVLLMMPEVRERASGLATACALVVFGVLLHRLNVAVIGLRVRHWESYVPSLGEVGITIGITAGAVFVFGVLIRILPIHEERPPAAAHTRSVPAWRAAKEMAT